MSGKGIIYNIQRMSVHDGPGIRTTVFFKGCPLRCQWCSNPESISFSRQLLVFENLCTGCGACDMVCPHRAVTREGERRNRDIERCQGCGVCAGVCPTDARAISGKEYSVDEVMRVVHQDSAFYRNSDGGVTFGGGECTAQGEFLLALLESSRESGLHTCVDTSGYCAPGLFEKILPLADLFLYDLKHMDPESHKRLTGADNAVILANLRTLLETDPQQVHIRMPLIPEVNDTDKNIAAMAEFLHPYECAAIEVMPYHLFGRNKYLALKRAAPGFSEYTPEALHAALERFARHNLAVTIV